MTQMTQMTRKTQMTWMMNDLNDLNDLYDPKDPNNPNDSNDPNDRMTGTFADDWPYGIFYLSSNVDSYISFRSGLIGTGLWNVLSVA